MGAGGNWTLTPRGKQSLRSNVLRPTAAGLISRYSGLDQNTSLNLMLGLEGAVSSANDAFQDLRSYVSVNEDGVSTVKKESTVRSNPINLPNPRKRGIDGLSPLSTLNQMQPSVKIKMSKNENSAMQQQKSIANMLKMACGTSSATFEFNGWMSSDVGSRATTFMCFRHNIGSDATPDVYTSTTADPTLASLNILSPVAGDGPLPGYETVTGASAAIDDNNPYHHHGNYSTWFHPMSRSKFEDTSWNMNKLKFLNNMYLAGSSVSNSEGKPSNHVLKALAINDEVAFGDDEYARTSHIYSNNLNAVNVPAQDTSMPLSYVQNNYNMVFNKGKVTYEFANKGDGPTQCEIIVYKVKRQNRFLSHDLDDFIKTGESAGTKGIPKFLHPPIIAGAAEKYSSMPKMGSVGGNDDPNADLLTHPGKKLYPQSKFTRQGNLPFKECQRVPFTMISGGRRTVSLDFGGDVYDPTNVVVSNNLSQGYPSADGEQKYPILDEHSFIVCLSIHGVSATRVYGVNNDRLGDIYAPARLEWKAKYEESIGAAQFSDGTSRLRMNGRTHKYPGSTHLITDTAHSEKASVILPMSGMIRTSNGDASVDLDGK